MNSSITIPDTERVLFLLALFVAIIYGVRLTAPVITIVMVSAVLALLLYPATVWLRRKGLPPVGAVSMVTLIALVCIALVLYLTISSFDTILRDLPQYQQDLQLRLADITVFLSLHGMSLADLVPQTISIANNIPTVISAVTDMGQDLMDLFFVGVTTFFMLLEAPAMINRVSSALADQREKLSTLGRMSGFVVDFIVVRTETNLVHGVLFGGVLAVMGVHAAILWGILTFVLGYIPYLGLILAAIPAIFFAWLQFGIWGAVAVIAVVCFLNLIVENPVFSYLAARRFEIPALVVILSVIFWGWLLGFAGMLFSVPFTLLVATLFEFSDELCWINQLLGLDHLFPKTDAQPVQSGG